MLIARTPAANSSLTRSLNVLSFEVTNAVTGCRDAKNHQFLELAETANVEMIVSSDADLTVLQPWRDIPILPPSASLVGVRQFCRLSRFENAQNLQELIKPSTLEEYFACQVWHTKILQPNKNQCKQLLNK